MPLCRGRDVRVQRQPNRRSRQGPVREATVGLPEEVRGGAASLRRLPGYFDAEIKLRDVLPDQATLDFRNCRQTKPVFLLDLAIRAGVRTDGDHLILR